MGKFYAARLAEFNSYLNAREQACSDAAERKAIEAERAACKRRMEQARRGYTGMTAEEKGYWDGLRSELDAALNLWRQSAEAEEGEKQLTYTAAHAALDAAQNAYVAQMRYVMAQLGMAACSLGADTASECALHFRAELQREYRQDFLAMLYRVPWGLEVVPDDEAEPEEQPHSHQSEDDEEGTVDLLAGEGEAEPLEVPDTPLMVQELIHESEHTDADRAASVARATALWKGYLSLCAQQIEFCFGTERGCSLVAGMPLPGMESLSYFADVQAHALKLFQEAELAWNSYVETVVAAYEPGVPAPEGEPPHAEAQLLRLPLYATHEQYLAFVLSPHLQYAEPEPLPDTGMVE